MADPLARANVIAYRQGEALNWHFDRCEFTTTLLLQAPERGGEFQYRSDLRSESDPNYDGVARLLAGRDPEVKTLPLAPGTLNVFKGRYTAHRRHPGRGRARAHHRGVLLLRETRASCSATRSVVVSTAAPNPWITELLNWRRDFRGKAFRFDFSPDRAMFDARYGKRRSLDPRRKRSDDGSL